LACLPYLSLYVKDFEKNTALQKISRCERIEDAERTESSLLKFSQILMKVKKGTSFNRSVWKA